MQTKMMPTRSFVDRLLSKGPDSPPVGLATPDELPSRPSPMLLRKKALSMFNLFSHHQHQQEHSSPCERPSGTTASAPQRLPTAGRRQKLKKCASASGTPTLAKSGWGMVPVLNELEQRASFRRPRWSRRESQCVCLNCGCLFFKQLSGVEADFCSLDCQASHAYTLDMQDVVDTQLELSDSTDGWSDTSSSVRSFLSGS